ncbi:hypothetical protein GCM10025867_49330 (plasmid) [Frondihabitans sucicola]|uniref:Uncharacterized protein n=1 Tax=Frondihabitans sucicola TaxID=1268041 RepID=A0ABN6Y5S2_9MICO|nr:hypothetical protein [Frondihabitans sucicola]BDZ52692.1 hypothetical protein GCM10025867_49330 [Frondihabitans sucicola]
MTDDTDFTPPKEPSGVLRGIMLVMLVTIVLAAFTSVTLEPSFFTPAPIILGIAIVVAYVAVALVMAVRWRKAQNAWALKASQWMSKQGARMATVQDILAAERPKGDLPPEFDDAVYVRRIERPLGDIYFAVIDGNPVLFEVFGESVRRVPTMTERAAELATLTDEERTAAAGLPFGLPASGIRDNNA